MKRRLLALVVATIAGGAVLGAVAAGRFVPAKPDVPVIRSDAETKPSMHHGDSIDDPAIWVNTARPASSLIIANDKKGALETYDLAGNRLQRVTDSVAFWGNVDVRGDLVVAYHKPGLRVFRVDPATRRLTNVTEGGAIRTSGEGVCLYRSRSALYAFTVVRAAPSKTRQYELTDADNDHLYAGTLRRTFDVGSEAEGCVADDRTGALYVSEEDVAVWRYSADPSGGSRRTVVDTVVGSGGHLRPDIEGITLAGDRLIVSAQSSDSAYRSYFASYERGTGRFVAAFRVGVGAVSDDCDGSDGVAAYAGDLGPAYPHGVFVCQDTRNQTPRANQNLKLVRWEKLP